MLSTVGGTLTVAGGAIVGLGRAIYVSPSGSDTANGHNPNSAVATLAHATSQLRAGDTLLLERGGTWHESLTVPADRITVGAYGTGADPILDGSDAHTSGWTQIMTAASLSAPLNTNPSFASWTSTNPDSWSLDNYTSASTSATFIKDSTDTNSTYAVDWVRSQSGLIRALNTMGVNAVPADTSKTYRLRMRVRLVSGTIAPTIGMCHRVATNNPQWLQSDGTFTAPTTTATYITVPGVTTSWQWITVASGIVPPASGGYWYQIEVRDNNSNGEMHIDAVELDQEIPAAPTGVYSKTVGSSTGVVANGSPGVVLHGSTPLPWVEWNTDQPTTVGLMGGSGYATSGCYSQDKNQTVYVRLPSNADPGVDGTVRVGMRQDCVAVESRTGVTITGLDLRGSARHGVWAYGVTNLTVNATISCLGGMWDPAGFYVGNGLDCGGVSTGVTYNLTVTDIFDSGMTPQVYENGANVSNVTGTLSATRCGLAGLEVVILPGYTGQISNVNVTVTARDIGKGWSGKRTNADHSYPFGHGVIVETNTTGTITGVTLPDLDVQGCAGYGVHINRYAGRVTIDKSANAYARIVGNDGGGLLVESVNSGETAALTLHHAVVTGNGGPGLNHNNWNGGIFDVQRCTIARNGGSSANNLHIDGFSGNPILADTVMEGNGQDAAEFLYWPNRAAFTGNLYHRVDAGTVVANNGTTYTDQATYRSGTGETTALFADPLFTDPANGNYSPGAGSPLIGAGSGGGNIGAL